MLSTCDDDSDNDDIWCKNEPKYHKTNIVGVAYCRLIPWTLTHWQQHTNPQQNFDCKHPRVGRGEAGGEGVDEGGSPCVGSEILMYSQAADNLSFLIRYTTERSVSQLG